MESIRNMEAQAVGKPETVHVSEILYSKKQVAQRLSLSVRSVENLIRAKELAAVRIGRSVRIPADALREFTRKSHATHIVN